MAKRRCNPDAVLRRQVDSDAKAAAKLLGNAREDFRLAQDRGEHDARVSLGEAIDGLIVASRALREAAKAL